MILWLGLATVVILVPHVELAKVSTAFKNAGITSDIVPTDPEDIANIEYLSEVCLGEELRETDVIYQPRVTYKYRPRVNYTIMLIDPDIPSIVAPGLRSALHWMVVNIPGNNISAGFTVAVYVPPVSYPGSGCHRFILLVYAQRRTLDITNQGLSRFRVNSFRFSVSAFVSEYGLDELVAANFFWTCATPVTDQYYCKA